MRLYVLCAMTLAACAFEPTGPHDPGDEGTPDPGIPSDVDAGVVGEPPVDPTPPDPPPAPEPPTVACRIEDAHLGIDGLRARVGGRTYTFASWQRSPQGESIGFTLTGPANVRYEVRTTDDRRMVESLVYEGIDSITRVDFCVGFDD